jgi:hypothetical protein
VTTMYRNNENKKPWSTTTKRVCEGKGCTAVLSRYNKFAICATCDAATEIADKPYRHQF